MEQFRNSLFCTKIMKKKVSGISSTREVCFVLWQQEILQFQRQTAAQLSVNFKVKFR